MSRKRPLYAWDTCVFLAHMKQEAGKPLADIAAVIQEVESNAADMIVSITTHIELLDIVDNPQLAAMFNGFLQRRNVLLIDVNPTVADAALQIRYKGNKSTPKRNVKIGDAQIAGTALAYEADVLHSFDPDLLKLSKSPIVGELLIVHPVLLSGQTVMEFEDSEITPAAPVVKQQARPLHKNRHHVDGYGPARSAFEIACSPRSLSFAHR